MDTVHSNNDIKYDCKINILLENRSTAVQVSAIVIVILIRGRCPRSGKRMLLRVRSVTRFDRFDFSYFLLLSERLICGVTDRNTFPWTFTLGFLFRRSISQSRDPFTEHYVPPSSSGWKREITVSVPHQQQPRPSSVNYAPLLFAVCLPQTASRN